MRLIEGPRDTGVKPDIYIVQDSEGRSAELEGALHRLHLGICKYQIQK